MATIITIVVAATIIAENQQEKDNKPKDCVIAVEDTSSVVAATITK